MPGSQTIYIRVPGESAQTSAFFKSSLGDSNVQPNMRGICSRSVLRQIVSSKWSTVTQSPCILIFLFRMLLEFSKISKFFALKIHHNSKRERGRERKGGNTHKDSTSWWATYIKFTKTRIKCHCFIATRYLSFITHRSFFLLYCANQFAFLMEEINYIIKREYFLHKFDDTLKRGVLGFICFKITFFLS